MSDPEKNAIHGSGVVLFIRTGSDVYLLDLKVKSASTTKTHEICKLGVREGDRVLLEKESFF